MRDSDDGRFFEVWRRAHRLTGNGRAPDAEQLDGAFEALSHYPIEAIEAALNAHVRDPETGQFQPRPADVVRQIDGTPTDRANAALAKFNQTVRLVGGEASVVFDDPLIHCVVRDMGGWPKVTAWTDQEKPFREKDFCALYAGYSRRNATPPYPAKLIGLHERQNASDGYAIAPPVLVGDQSRAALVYQEGAASNTLAITSGSSVKALLATTQARLQGEA